MEMNYQISQDSTDLKSGFEHGATVLSLPAGSKKYYPNVIELEPFSLVDFLME